ncbi:MAG TPA: MBL fold metallo-hydrolase, partial [Thermomicrobiales bacterium]|nr:MBL fold metallo-hydrolase [Thermomicrobiales bacterium]
MSDESVGTFDPATAVREIEPGFWQIDIGFQGRSGVIATYLIEGPGELVLIETGPSSCLPQLRDGLAATGHSIADLTHILVTHIHLDHSGAAGPILRENPQAKVFAHPLGVPHLIDPSRLVASATRIYGDQMEPLWGEFCPIPESQVHALQNGEVIEAAGHRLQAIFTPGHAQHHVAYIDLASKFGFTGDVGGVRMQGTEYVCPPTPPPDLNREQWWESIRQLQSLDLQRLYLTHFGEFRDVERHLADLGPNLDQFLELGASAIDQGQENDAISAILHERMANALGNVPAGIVFKLERPPP